MAKIDRIEDITRGYPPLATVSDKRFYLPRHAEAVGTAGTGLQAQLQDFLKRYRRLYYFLVHAFSPVLINPGAKRRVARELDGLADQSRILCLGSGPERFLGRPEIINLDIFPFQEVDIVADAMALPVRGDSVDAVVNVAMLEHVSNPARVVAEMRRILRPGGLVVAYVPFLMPVHAAPGDYNRWTASGARELFGAFTNVEIVVGAGPTSALAWLLADWLALVLSFGIPNLRDFLFMGLMILTAPLKLLDLALANFSGSERLAAAFYIFARKPLVEGHDDL